ncbi:ATP cone domain-containing protein [Paraclostridium bifermentans]|nr:ATP cone domain-containing protein [Paraclostridium bifermentans]
MNSEKGIDKNLGNEIANKVEEILRNSDKSLNVEEIQDLVEVLLMESNRKDVAKHYILYREKRANIRKNLGIWMNYKNLYGKINTDIIKKTLMNG